MRNGDLESNALKEFPFRLCSFDKHLGFLDALQSRKRFDVQVFERKRTSRDHFVGRAQSRFHDASRVGKYIRGTRRHPQGGIHRIVRERTELNARPADHPAEFPGG